MRWPSGEKLTSEARGQVEHLRDAAVGRNEEEPVEIGQVADAIRAEEDATVGRPAQDHVVRRMIGQALRLAAPGRDDEDVVVAVVLAGEGDPLPVGRELRIELVAGMRGQTARRSALRRRPSTGRRRKRRRPGRARCSAGAGAGSDRPERLSGPRRNRAGARAEWPPIERTSFAVSSWGPSSVGLKQVYRVFRPPVHRPDRKAPSESPEIGDLEEQAVLQSVVPRADISPREPLAGLPDEAAWNRTMKGKRRTPSARLVAGRIFILSVFPQA